METLTRPPQVEPRRLLGSGDNLPPKNPRAMIATEEPPRYGHPMDNFGAGQHELRTQTDGAFQQIARAEEQREFRQIDIQNRE